MLFRDGDAIAANVLRFRYVGCLLHLNFERITTYERGNNDSRRPWRSYLST